MCLIILEFLTWFIAIYFFAFHFFSFLIIFNVRRRGKLVDLTLYKYFHLFSFYHVALSYSWFYILSARRMLSIIHINMLSQ